MTHGPPRFHMDNVEIMGKQSPVGCLNLLAALNRARPTLSVFGHIHEGWGAERVLWDVEQCNADKLTELESVHGTRSSGPTTDVARPWRPREGTEALQVSLENATEEGFAYCNISKDSERPLQRGQKACL